MSLAANCVFLMVVNPGLFLLLPLAGQWIAHTAARQEEVAGPSWQVTVRSGPSPCAPVVTFPLVLGQRRACARVQGNSRAAFKNPSFSFLFFKDSP